MPANVITLYVPTLICLSCDNHTKEVPLCRIWGFFFFWVMFWFRKGKIHSFMWMDFAVHFHLRCSYYELLDYFYKFRPGVLKKKLWPASSFSAAISLILICCLSWAWRLKKIVYLWMVKTRHTRDQRIDNGAVKKNVFFFLSPEF